MAKPVATPKVVFISGRRNIACLSGPDGSFVCQVSPDKNFTLEITASGFALYESSPYTVSDWPRDAEFRLAVAEIRDQVVVTAARTETRLGETPASVTTFSRANIDAAASPAIDDILRQSAGFSIFRRSSSRNANPTTQGVSLRGVGASGASRSLVLDDGVSLNDVFGGWVQWERVAPVSIGRIEILRGGASGLYGDDSLSGAINIIPQTAEGKYVFSSEVFGGTQKTLSGSAFFGSTVAGWELDLTGLSYQTRGYIMVDEAQRGPVDRFSGTRSSNYSARIGRKINDFMSIFVRPSYFGEVRTNGTGLQTNRTHIRQLIFGGELNLEKVGISLAHSRVNWRVFGGTQVYDQVFSTVNAARTSESLLRLQRVPAQNLGFSAQFSGVYKTNTFVAGIESRSIRGASDEIAISNNLAISLVGSGGREQTAGAFFQDFARIGKKLVVAGTLRFDHWRNLRGLSATRTLATNQTVTTVFQDRIEQVISPNISVLYHVSDGLSLYANASTSFRAPTLNELYRSFRVGNVLTLANESLRAERARNVEGGISFGGRNMYVRAAGFWTSISNPVANVTLTSTQTLITRQRQNAGRTGSRGIEAAMETNVKRLNLSAGYLFADSTVTSFPSNPQLVGLAIPQVARHQYTFQARYASARGWTFALQARGSSHQFDDDLNLFRLEPYFQLDLFAEKKLGSGIRVFAGLENMFNTRYSVGLTPIRTVSSPINFRTGFRWAGRR